MSETTYYGLTVPQMIGITVGLFVIIFIYVIIKDKINRKKAQGGGDRDTVWNILQNSIPEIGQYTRAYGCWEWSTYQGKKTTTTYWYYGVAFNNDRLFVVPLSCEGGDISYSDAYCIEKKDVAIVNSKKGAQWVELYDMHQKELLSISVFPENLNDDKYHPVNIIQPEEAQAFIRWKDTWMDEINRANHVEVTGKMKKPVKVQKV
ncbi:MAG: hypothetical protein HFI91_00175 [Lachnospiraceae bacterium]|jgi:hypothetical protein|nr:hypothetical protein [Lachnospiraceae bacterium]